MDKKSLYSFSLFFVNMKECCFSPVLKTARDCSATKDLTKERKKNQKSKKTLRQLNDFSIPVFPKIVQQLKHFFIREHPFTSLPLGDLQILLSF